MDAAINPRIEALWGDRHPFVLTGSVFGDLRLFEAQARDAADEIPYGAPHPLGYVPRVVVDVASERLLRTGAYFAEGTMLLDGIFGSRLVIGPPIPDGNGRFLASLGAAETYATRLARLIGGNDGYVRVISFPPEKLAKGLGLDPWR